MDKKEQIIVAAMKLLVEKGIQATPMSAIARAAGTGMGTIYNYFPTKEELVNAIYLYIKGSEINTLFSSMKEESSVKAKFLQFYASFVNFYLKYPQSFEFIDQLQNSPIIKESTKEEGKKAFLPIFQLIEQGQNEGIIKKTDIEAILYFLAGTISTYVRWLLSKTEAEQQKLLKEQLRMAWDAIKE